MTNNNQEHTGKIERIIHDNERGKAGFIKSNGNEYYFSVNHNFKSISKIVVGIEVTFKIKPPKDDVSKERAINIRLLPSYKSNQNPPTNTF